MFKTVLTVSALALAACCPGHGDDDPTTRGNTAYVTVPGVVECNGTVTSEFVGSHTWLPVLRCDDGRIFHNISNYSIRQKTYAH